MCDRELTQEQWDQLMSAIETRDADRAARLPDEAACIAQIQDAYLRLKDLGWRDATYAPKNTPIEVIEVGGTGIFRGQRWDSGLFMVEDGGDLWPSKPCLFRPATPRKA